MRKSRRTPTARRDRSKQYTPAEISLIIPGGWFGGRTAKLRTNTAGDWVRIDGDTEFCVKDGKISLSIDDVGQAGEFRRIYDLVRKRRREWERNPLAEGPQTTDG